MTKKTANDHGIDWDGTKEDVRRVRKNIEGKIFKLDLGIKEALKF